MFHTDCPPRPELAAYSLGNLPPQEIESIADHIDACETCQSALATLSDASDTLVDQLRQPPPADEYAQEESCRRAIARVGAFVPSPAVADTPASPEPLLAIAAALGEYELLDKLGEGGMGAVYLARQKKLKRLVAVKLLPKERLADAKALARFEREMEAVGAVDHPNIVRAMHAGEANGTPYLVVEYVEGMDLSKLISATGALRVADACELVRQAAVGLQHAHEQGLVHRDIKPSNLMLNRQGTVKILDLGLALLGTNQPNRPEMTAAGTAMGTADYVSPEQVTDSHSVDIRSDIYSLGCTLYKLLSGRAPFVGPEFKNDVTKMMAHVDKTPPPISLLRTDLPPGLAKVIEQMMAKKPADRFSTPGEGATALGPFAAGCDLGRLSNEANGMLGLPSVETPHSASTGKLSGSAHGDTGVSVSPAEKPILAPAGSVGSGRRRMWITVAAAAASFLLIALGVIVIRIRDKSGRETVIQAPPGSTVTLEENGKQVVQVPTPDEDANPAPKPMTLALTPEPLNLAAGAPMSELALVARPAPLPDVRSWTIETRGHRGAISSIAYRPDGTQLLTAGDDGTVRIWDTTDGHLVRALVGASAPVVWSPDGRLVAASATRNSLVIAGLAWPIPIPKYAITIWDPKAGRLLKTMPLDNPVLRMDWSPDGKSLAATVVRYTDPIRVSYFGGHGPFLTRVFDIESGRCLSVLPEGGDSAYLERARTRSIRWSPDGSVLAETFPDGVRRWDVLARKFLPYLPLNHASDCCWSPDGTWLLASGFSPHGVGATRVWESATGKEISKANADEAAVDWLPDGRTMVARAGQGELVLLDAATGDLCRKLGAKWTYWTQHGFSRWGNDGLVGTSPDGKFLVSVEGPSLSIVDVESGRPYLRIPGHIVQVRRMGWTPDGARLGISGDAPGVDSNSHGAFWIFDAMSGGKLNTVGSTYPRFCSEWSEWSPDGKMIPADTAGGPPKSFLWDTVSDSLVRALDTGSSITCFAWSPDGKRLAAWKNTGKGEVEIFNTDTGQSLKTLTQGVIHAQWANLLWSPSGKSLVVSDCDAPNGTSIWDVESGTKLGQVSGRVFALAFSPDGETIAAGFDNGAIALREAASGKVINHFQKSETPVVSLHWSPDGKRILSGTLAGEIYEWDCQSGQVLRTVSGVVPEAFCPDGKYVGYPRKAGGTVGGSRPVVPFARIWETETGRPQGTIVLLGDDAWLTLAADGHYVCSPGVQQQLIYVVQTDQGQETLTPDEFSEKYGWKNDPEKVTLTGEPSGQQPAGAGESPKDADQPEPAEPTQPAAPKP
jgi:serine/threonine protein kinase/dipeptidyl aminopeptidase/acylaminoacyl peptidase